MSANYHPESAASHRVYLRSCNGKRRFVSKKIARGNLRTLLKREGTQHDGRNHLLGVYSCRACHAWHIGHFMNPLAAGRSRG